MAEANNSNQLDDLQKLINLWKQGDCVLGENWFLHKFNPIKPITQASIEESKNGNEIVETSCFGFVVTTQTCDIVRDYKKKPFLEVAPIVKLSNKNQYVEAQKGYRPQFAILPSLVQEMLVADLDRSMTIEKAFLAQWDKHQSCLSDEDGRKFARALARKKSRFAFPNSFTEMTSKLQERIKQKHDKQSEEGINLRSTQEIRVRAAPSWQAEEIQLTFWFIKNDGANDFDQDKIDEWLNYIELKAPYRSAVGFAVTLDDITARDYVESDVLDLDHLTLDGKT